MLQRTLDFERLDSRKLCAVVGIGEKADAIVEHDDVHVDPAAGEVTVYVFSPEEPLADQGSLNDLEFSPHDPAADVSAENEGDNQSSDDAGDNLCDDSNAELSDDSDAELMDDSGGVLLDDSGDVLPDDFGDEAGDVSADDVGDEDLGQDVGTEDYINPRVRTQLDMASQATATSALPNKSSTVLRGAEEGESPDGELLLSRYRNGPMGPISLIPHKATPSIAASLALLTAEPLATLSPEEQRLLKCAA